MRSSVDKQIVGHKRVLDKHIGWSQRNADFNHGRSKQRIAHLVKALYANNCFVPLPRKQTARPQYLDRANKRSDSDIESAQPFSSMINAHRSAFTSAEGCQPCSTAILAEWRVRYLRVTRVHCSGEQAPTMLKTSTRRIVNEQTPKNEIVNLCARASQVCIHTFDDHAPRSAIMRRRETNSRSVRRNWSIDGRRGAFDEPRKSEVEVLRKQTTVCDRETRPFALQVHVHPVGATDIKVAVRQGRVDWLTRNNDVRTPECCIAKSSGRVFHPARPRHRPFGKQCDPRCADATWSEAKA